MPKLLKNQNNDNHQSKIRRVVRIRQIMRITIRIRRIRIIIRIRTRLTIRAVEILRRSIRIMTITMMLITVKARRQHKLVVFLLFLLISVILGMLILDITITIVFSSTIHVVASGQCGMSLKLLPSMGQEPNQVRQLGVSENRGP